MAVGRVRFDAGKSDRIVRLDHQPSGTGTLLAKDVIGITQWAFGKRETTATDTARYLIAKLHQTVDTFLKHIFPGFRKAFPVLCRRDVVVRKIRQGFTNDRQRDACALRDLDDSDAAQHSTVIATLISLCTPPSIRPLVS